MSKYKMLALGSNIFLFSLSGPIGAGKSTLALFLAFENLLEKKISEKLPHYTVKVIIVQEPVNEWRAKGWLSEFYTDPEKNALPFQILVYKTHVAGIQRALQAYSGDKDTLVICLAERSMWDQLLFWKLQVDLGGQTSLADTAYMQDWSLWKQMIPSPTRIFYCKPSSLEETIKRIKARDRLEELSSESSYHKALWEKHEDWYVYRRNIPSVFLYENVPVTIINMDNHFHKDSVEIDYLVNAILSDVSIFE